MGKSHAMEEKYDKLTGFIGGILGGGFYFHFMDLTWEQIWSNALNLVWLGVVALFTGGMGVLGKHLVSQYLLKRKNKKQ